MRGPQKILMRACLSLPMECWPASLFISNCCDTRHLMLRNEAAISEIISALCIGRTKLISNQRELQVVYAASCIPSRTKALLPLVYNKSEQNILFQGLTNTKEVLQCYFAIQCRPELTPTSFLIMSTKDDNRTRSYGLVFLPKLLCISRVRT